MRNTVKNPRISPGAIAEVRSLAARAYRSVYVFGTASLIAAQYLRVQRQAKRLPKEQAEKLWEQQHRRSARRLANMAMRLRGMLVKSAQYMSARPDLLPEPYIEALSALQDAVPPKPFRLIATQIERELGAPPDQLFATFARQPVASASLAQVHAATLRDGRKVAVKVLYPDIEALVRADLRNLGLIVNIVGRIWSRYDFRVIYREVERLVPIELDLSNEAENLERIRSELSHRDDVLIPASIPEFSSARVLTMDFVDGIKVNDVAALRAAGLDPTRIARNIVDMFGEQVLVHGFFHGDPHPGNIFVIPDGRVALLDFGQSLLLPEGPRRGFALLSHSAAARDPAGMIRAIQMIGIHLPATDMAAYMHMARNTLGMFAEPASEAEHDPDSPAGVNVRMARGFRGISLDAITGEALFVFRVQGLLRGLRFRLGSPGNIITAWSKYADEVVAETAAD
jgi:predicted unusual protein kinase regulating ubiquinone biosynthesis (AarF/ABC1/UbiB family)